MAIGAACETCAIWTDAARLGDDGAWTAGRNRFAPIQPTGDGEALKAQIRSLPSAPVEIRTVQRRQAYLGGQPVGEPFE